MQRWKSTEVEILILQILAAYDTNVVLEKIIKLHFPEVCSIRMSFFFFFFFPTANYIRNGTERQSNSFRILQRMQLQI
jgi:hypothetical protein